MPVDRSHPDESKHSMFNHSALAPMPHHSLRHSSVTSLTYRLGLAGALLCVACSSTETGNDDASSRTQDLTLVKASVVSAVAASTLVSSAVLKARIPPAPAQDCSMFDAYTAALGAYTVDCLGTIGPNAFGIDDKGYLRRRFEKCTDGSEERLKTIDGLLSMQVREHQRPNKLNVWLDPVACISGRYQTWAARFKESGIRECPRWEKLETIGEVNEGVVSAYAKLLPQLDPKEGTLVREEPPAAKQNFRYKVYFESGTQDKGCADPGSCAAACVGGFPGALVKAEGETIVLDPDYWLDPNATTVYRVGGYYHGMSYKGGVPGDLWGHANRAGESCSYYYFDDGSHYLGYLAKVPAVGIFASEMTECMPL